jgi:AraC-like DNA-binding protein
MPSLYPDDRVKWVAPANLGGWEYLIAHQSRHLWAIYHETYTICACRSCGPVWRYRGQKHTLPGRGTMLMEPGELHRTLSVPPVTAFKVAVIPPERMEATAREVGLSGTPHLRMAETGDLVLTNLVWHLGLAVEEGGSPLELQTLQTRILHRLLIHAERTPPSMGGREEPRAVALARQYLHDNVAAPVTLDELAAVAGINRFRLVHAFASAVGVPPHAYQVQIRVERSRSMLRLGMAGAEAAAGLGFTDQAHFIRHFKRIMKVTPGHYQRSASHGHQ